MPVKFDFSWYSRVSRADVHGEEHCIGSQYTLLWVCTDVIQPRKRYAASFLIRATPACFFSVLEYGLGG